MKSTSKSILAALVFAASFSFASADDRPVTYSQLPAVAQTFINSNFPGAKVSYAMMDDDFIRPDYKVVLDNGIKVQFDNDGRLENIESRQAEIPKDIIPVQIRDYVRLHYPDAAFIEYEIGRRTYDVKLSNRLELKFNRNFNLVEMDD